jgi:hypothetical protein
MRMAVDRMARSRALSSSSSDIAAHSPKAASQVARAAECAGRRWVTEGWAPRHKKTGVFADSGQPDTPD